MSDSMRLFDKQSSDEQKLERAVELIKSLPAPNRMPALSVNARAALDWLTRYEELQASEKLPSWVPVKEWTEYLKSCRALGKPKTKRAQAVAISKLRKMYTKGVDIREALQQSADNGWVGVFEPKSADHREMTRVAAHNQDAFPDL